MTTHAQLPIVTALAPLTSRPSVTPLTSVTGGSPTLVLAVFVALFVATVLSVYLALRLYRGYRAVGDSEMLLLGVGLVMLTTAPILLRLVLTNVPEVAPTTRTIAATACQLVGLLVMLGVIFDR